MDDVAAVLRENGLRVTGPRIAVWRALSQAGAHLTVEEIAAEVSRTDPAINVASIYRALDVLGELGLVREVRLPDDDAGRWEIDHPDDHFHLVCDDCGKVTHHPGRLVETIRRHLDGDHGFESRQVELVVSGRCQHCRAD